MPDLIVTLPDFKRYLRHNGNADDQQLTGVLTAAHDLIYHATGRTFGAVPVDPLDPDAPAAETRYFAPPAPWQPMVIDDLADGTGLTLAYEDTPLEVLPADTYTLEPRQRRPGWPYTSVRFISGLAQGTIPQFDLDPYWWPRSRSRMVAVTSARWGWPAVPYLAGEAIKIVAKNLWNYRTTSFGAATLPGDVTMMVAGDPQVDAMVIALRRNDVAAPRTINVETSL
jgi:hypothetical protein